MKNIITFLLIIVTVNIYGQSTISTNRVYIPWIVGIGYGHESSISEKFTLNYQFEVNMSMGAGDWEIEDSDWGKDHLVIQPSFYFEPRYYYNIYKRFSKGKNVKNNAADYISINSSIDFPIGASIWGSSSINPEFGIRIAPTWGLRRNFYNNLDLDMSFYGGVKFPSPSGQDTPLNFIFGMRFSLGYYY